MGLRHPLEHLRGKAIRTLRGEGVQVDVLGEELQSKKIEVPDFLFFIFTFLYICDWNCVLF